MACATACASRSASPGGAKEADSATAAPASGDVATLPLPAVPAEMTEPADRAAFVTAHFWDALDFGSDPQALDSAFMEQNFANFLSVLAVTPSEQAQHAVDNLLSRSLERPEAFDILWWVTTHYLDDPNSPMRDEELLILFLRHASADNNIPEATRQRSAFRLTQALKNRRGTTGADFRYIGRDGTESTLHRALRGAAQTIEMFYDPDCEVCADVEKRLASDQELNSRIKSGEVQILAIDPFGTDPEEWSRHAATLPEQWTVGRSPGGEVDEKEIYDIRATPTIYILDSAGTVIGKDVAF